MSAASSTRGGNRLVVIALWVGKILLALAFGAAALAKLSGQPMMVDEFGKIGLGQGFRYVVAIIELGSAILLLVPRTAFYGALGLCAVCVGAFVAQIGPLHGDIVHVLVLGALAAAVAWFSRPVAVL